MVESVEKRDIVNVAKILFVGHDTGLMKKVKLNMKRQQNTHRVSYGQAKRIQFKRRKNEDGDEEKVTIERSRGRLTAEDDQERIRYETEIGFKLLDRTGSMEKNSGILCPTWTLQGNKRYVTMLRGQLGCVQTYDSLDSTSKLVKYEEIEGKAKGLHCIVKGMSGVENDLDDLDILPVQHLMITDQAHCYLSNLDEEGKME